jgi:hypothetical protein
LPRTAFSRKPAATRSRKRGQCASPPSSTTANGTTSTRFFRDALIADPALLAAYAAEKRRIVDSGVTDPLEYRYAKDAFVEKCAGAASRPARLLTAS